MKKKLLVLAFGLALAVSVNAQTNTFPTSGNVGIGTTNPATNIEIAGSSNGSSNNSWINMDVTATSNPKIYSKGWNANLDLYTYTIQGSSNLGQLHLHTNGNVGIGTTNPGAKLEVNGGISITGMNSISSTNGFHSSIQFLDPSCAAIVYQPGTANELMFGFHSNGNFYWGTGKSAGNSYCMSLTKGGNLNVYNAIGIGVASPGAALSFGNLNDGRNTPDGITWLSSYPLSYGIYRTSGPWTSPDYQQLKLAWATGIVIDGGSSYGKSGIELQPNGGNVLIGKTSQTNTAYKLDVAGKIRANEVVVNTNGADYVFNPSYKLCSLSSLEAYVQQHKHLPGIASAKEMKANGVGMATLQTKLLQKVEELTLYTIAQDKAKNALTVRIEEQAKVNNELKQQLTDQAKEIEQLKQLITQKLKP